MSNKKLLTKFGWRVLKSPFSQTLKCANIIVTSISVHFLNTFQEIFAIGILNVFIFFLLLIHLLLASYLLYIHTWVDGIKTFDIYCNDKTFLQIFFLSVYVFFVSFCSFKLFYFFLCGIKIKTYTNLIVLIVVLSKVKFILKCQ